MSDEEDYDQLDEAYDDDDNSKNKKPRNSFIDDIAEESDDDDGLGDDDEGEDDKEQDGFLAPEDELLNEEPYQPRIRNANFPGNNRSTMEDIESSVEYFKKRYGNSYNYKESSFQGDFDSDVAPAALQPTANDPKLWLVKCKIGSEKSMVLALMRKAAEFANSDEPLEIYSVVSRESLKGYIYIEAVKRAHVEKAIANLTSIYGSKIQLVPTSEMVDVLTIRKDQQKKIGTWVRLRRGIYNGDLAQVIEHDENKGTVLLRVIPRIDFNQDQNANGDKRKRPTRPPQRRLTPAMMQKLNAERHSDYDMVNNNRYKDGYLILEQKIKLLQIDDVSPTLDEALKFQSRYDEQRDDEATKADIEGIVASINETKASETRTNFQMGDMVEVREGSLKNLVGVIKNVQGDIVTIIPKHHELTATINLSTREIRKHFSAGNHVKITAGKYEGETGSIVHVESGVATIISDLSKQEIKAFTRDITTSNEIASSTTESISGFELHDLVMIDEQLAGVIVRLDREVFIVLDQNNNVRNMRAQELGSKRNNKFARAFDNSRNTMMSGDTVRIIEGLNKGKVGTIVHLYRRTAFVICKDISENSGVIATQTNNLSAVTRRPNQPSNERGSDYKGFDRRNDQRNSRDHKPDHLAVSKTVQIISGTYKGWIGRIRAITGRMVELDVHSSPRPISVPRDQVRPYDANDSKNQYQGSRTPRDYGSRTPSYAGGKTPLYGMTPSHEMRTWDSVNKPVWATDTPTSYPATPGFYATPSTPAADTPFNENPKTPGVGSSDFEAPTPYNETVMTPFGNVGTPHTPAIPNTPGVHDYDDDKSLYSWVKVGLEVNDKSGKNLFKRGKVTSISGNVCTVQSDKNEVTISIDNLDVSVPVKNNRVMVVKGEKGDKSLIGLIGELCSLLPNGECMIKIGEDVHLTHLNSICKVAE